VKFKLNENLPVELAAELRAMGHATVAGEGLCGEMGLAVVEAASMADRILLTLDKRIADVRSQRRGGVVLSRLDSAGRRASFRSSASGFPGSHRWTSQVG
jgi:hypothetical protein